MSTPHMPGKAWGTKELFQLYSMRKFRVCKEMKFRRRNEDGKDNRL